LFICPTTFTPILLGVCVAHALHDPRSYRFAGWIVRGVWAPAIYLALLIALLVALPLDISGLPRLGVQVCMALLLMSCVYHENHVLRPLLSLAPVKEIGKVSYGIYRTWWAGHSRDGLYSRLSSNLRRPSCSRS
jgi:peptidoglycan/LPS O-acetylase OafA/YrhL